MVCCGKSLPHRTLLNGPALSGLSAIERDNLLRRLLGAADEYARADHKDRRSAALTYLFELADYVTVETGSEDAIAPLLDIIPFVANPLESSLFGERRSAASQPSTPLLTRAAVAIDVFTYLGLSIDDAAQRVARQLINARVRLPDEGHEVRGWKRLLYWRNRLVNEHDPKDEFDAYMNLINEIKRLPRNQIVALAADGRLWNSRAWNAT